MELRSVISHWSRVISLSTVKLWKMKHMMPECGGGACGAELLAVGWSQGTVRAGERSEGVGGRPLPDLRVCWRRLWGLVRR